MAEHEHSGPIELGAEMDYIEHEKSYNFFLELAKYTTLGVVALLIAMAFGFFTAGFFSAAILFVLICGLGAFLLR